MTSPSALTWAVVGKLGVCRTETESPSPSGCRGRCYVHLRAGGAAGGAAGCCVSAATEAAEAGPPVPAPRLGWPAASGWTEEAGHGKAGGVLHASGPEEPRYTFIRTVRQLWSLWKLLTKCHFLSWEFSATKASEIEHEYKIIERTSERLMFCRYGCKVAMVTDKDWWLELRFDALPDVFFFSFSFL